MKKIEFIGKVLLVRQGKKKILVVGDLHLGYEEYMNRSGVFVSRKLFDEMINYFDRVFEKIEKVDYVILLGDVKHSFGEIMRQEWNDVLKLFDYFSEKCEKIVVVKGNHDVILEPIVRKNKKAELKDFFRVGEICFLHGDKEFKEIYNEEIKTWILGHVHPAIEISDQIKSEKYKCFLTGKFRKREIIIVPSFLDVNEGSDPRFNDFKLAWKFNFEKFDVFIVSGENLEVIEFGKLGKIN